MCITQKYNGGHSYFLDGNKKVNPTELNIFCVKLIPIGNTILIPYFSHKSSSACCTVFHANFLCFRASVAVVAGVFGQIYIEMCSVMRTRLAFYSVISSGLQRLARLEVAR